VQRINKEQAKENNISAKYSEITVFYSQQISVLLKQLNSCRGLLLHSKKFILSFFHTHQKCASMDAFDKFLGIF